MISRRRRFPRPTAFRASFAETLESRRLLAATTPELIADVNTAVESLNPGAMTTIGLSAYFAARDSVLAGREVFVTDGTAANTHVLAEVAAGLADADPQSMRNVGGTLFFSAADDKGDRELYKSDGTTAGTVRVKDIRPGVASSGPRELAAVGNTLYFNATDGVSGNELWKSDGTEAGTVLVTDLAPGAASGAPTALIEFNGSLLFAATATGSSADRKLFRLDLATGIVAPVTGSPADPRNLMRVGDAVLFNATLSGTSLARGDLYRTDGQTATLVKALDYTTSPGVDNTFIYGSTAANGLLFFRASLTNAATTDLWRSDGTADGTYVLADGALRGSNALATAGANGEVLFTRTTAANGAEPWLSDGTIAGTRLLKDLVSGPDSGVTNGLQVAGLRLGDQTFFTNNTDTTAGSLWVTDGTEANTRRLSGFDGDGRSFSILGSVGGVALFNGATRTGTGQLFRSDGTDAGTGRVPVAAGGNDSGMEETPDDGDAFARVGGSMYFAARDPQHGMELWRVDDATGDAQLVHDLYPGAADSSPGGMVVGEDGSLYFEATAPDIGRDLYRLAPGATTPTLVADVISSANVEDLVAAGNAVYFTARRYANHSSKHLWRYTPGTATLEPVSNISGHSFTEPTAVVRAGDFLYFGALARLADNSIVGTGYELWRMPLNGGGAELVKDINTNPGATSYATPLGAIGSTLLFSADNGSTGIELWRTDGTTAGTTLVKEMTPGLTHTYFVDFVPKFSAVVNGIMYFGASAYGESPTYLWRSDGTAAGTYQAGNVSRPGQFTVFGGSVYMIGDGPGNDFNHRSLYRTDGTDADGPLEVINGNDPARPTWFSSLHETPDHLYLLSITATTSVSTVPGAATLWRTAGVPGDAEPLFDLKPVPTSSADFWGGRALASSDTHLYFPLHTPATGIEPGRLALTDPPTLTDVFVSGTGWSPAFLDHLQATGQGSAAHGFRVDPAAAPDELPWTNLNKVSLRFAGPVTVAQADLAITGVNVAGYPVASFSYDPASFTATWTLSTGGIANDKLLLNLAGGGAAPATVRLNVLPGDVNRSGGSVLGSDVTLVRNAQNATPGAPGSLYTIFKDVNGSGSILGSDVTLVRNRQGTSLPSAEPVSGLLAEPLGTKRRTN